MNNACQKKPYQTNLYFWQRWLEVMSTIALFVKSNKSAKKKSEQETALNYNHLHMYDHRFVGPSRHIHPHPYISNTCYSAGLCYDAQLSFGG